MARPHRGVRGRSAPDVYGKCGVPRHRVICRQTADRLERAIETRERQGAQREIVEELADLEADRDAS